VLHRATMSSSLTEQSLKFPVNIIGIQAEEVGTSSRTALQYATELFTRYHNRNTWYSKLWERISDILQKSHANLTDNSY
jgi:hypothetical protein